MDEEVNALEKELNDSIKTGAFARFVNDYIGNPEQRLNELWRIIYSKICGMRYAAVEAVFGEEERFKLHGLDSLSSKEIYSASRPVQEQIQLHSNALITLRAYALENNLLRR